MGSTELDQRLESALHRLGDLDEAALDDVEWAIQQRTFYRWLQDLPLPLRIALIEIPIGGAFAVAFQPPPGTPGIAVLLMLIGSYCLTLTIASFTPRRRIRRMPPPTRYIHWLE